LYAYCADDPRNFADPLGLAGEVLGGTGGVAGTFAFPFTAGGVGGSATRNLNGHLQLSLTLQVNLMAGGPGYGGGGIVGGATYSPDAPCGGSTGKVLHGEGEYGAGPTNGGSVDYDPKTDAWTVARGLLAGAGAGLFIGGGVGYYLTLALPPVIH